MRHVEMWSAVNQKETVRASQKMCSGLKDSVTKSCKFISRVKHRKQRIMLAFFLFFHFSLFFLFFPCPCPCPLLLFSFFLLSFFTIPWRPIFLFFLSLFLFLKKKSFDVFFFFSFLFSLFLEFFCDFYIFHVNPFFTCVSFHFSCFVFCLRFFSYFKGSSHSGGSSVTPAFRLVATQPTKPKKKSL